MAQSTHRPFASGGIHWLGFLSVILIAAMLLVAAPQPAAAADPNPAPVQLFYVTLPETDGLAALDAINTAASTPVYTYFSIAVGVSGSYVYYDQWENGYAGDIANPTSAEIYNSATNPAGVQIWGNGKATDGCAPNIAGVAFTCTDAADVLNAGNVIIPYNAVPVPRVVTAQSNVLDNFSTAAYTNNNGNTNWASNWVETNDDGSATAGTIYIATGGGANHLRFREGTAANDSIDRGVNLSSGGGCATLSFTLGASNIGAGEDRLALQMSSDGVSYTTVATYTQASDAGAKSYGVSGYASANTRVRFIALDALETGTGDGNYWSIDDAQVSWNCSLPVLFDGKDKVGASSSIAMARATWATGSGTLNAFAHEMYATAEWGTAYESPVGTNTTNAGQMFEYSALSIMASQNNTTVQIDADANGTYETTVTLQEGGTTLATGTLQGARVLADKPVQVVLVTGDVDSTYASRDMNLLPTSAWGSSYWSSVGVINTASYPTRLYLYNLSTNGSIYITCERYGVANITLGPVAAKGVVTTDLVDGQGAHCFASTNGGVATTDKISAIGTIDTTNTAYDWSFTLYPDAYLTTDALVGLGLGKDPTNTTSTENGSPLWVTAACASGGTYVYVDWNNDGTADPVDTNGDDVAETGSQNGILVTRLQSVRLFEPGADTEPYDQSGARVWSRTTSGVGYGGDPGCNLALAWGEDPANATGGAPGLDVGTSIPPLRPIEGAKSAAIVTDTAPIGVLNPGDTVYYNITVHNAGTVQVDNVYVYDTVPNNTTYVASSTEWNTTGVAPWTAIADVGGTLPLAQTGGVLLGNLGADQTFYVRFKVTLLAGNYEDITNCDTAYTGAGSFSKCVTTPVATRDWGDLPDSYGTSASQNGPRHSSSGLMLGSLWDVEVQGQSSLGADGDDLATSDDEDGVTRNLSQLWLPGATVNLNVTVTGGTGVLGGWFDWNNDGDVADSGEFISFGTLSAGTNSVAVTIPSAYSAGASVYARFRLAASSNFPGGSLDASDYLGFAVGGEVEDYLWSLQSPELNVAKSSTTTAITAAGQVVPYSFVVTNVGNQILTGVTVSDPNCTSAISGPTGDTNSDGKLDLTETWTYTCNHTVTQAEIDAGGNLSNTVTADSTESGPDTDTKDIPITQAPALSLVKSVSPATYDAVGDVIAYSYVVKNVGNVTLAGPVTVADNKATVSCPAGGLAPGASLTCTASYTIGQADLDSGTVTNTAKASANGTDSNTDDETVTAEKKPALSLVKTATPATYSAVGDVISYSYLVTNIGNVTLAGPVTVADDKATVSCPAGGLAPGASMTCTASYTIDQADLDAGSVKNTAKASANGTDSNPDDETVTADKQPALSLVKSATPATYDEVGDIISYSYLVKNTGNVTLAGPVTVADDKATVSCPAGGLAPGASLTCTASYTIGQADLDNGSVKNTAQASANGTDSNTDDETVAAMQGPKLTLVKTATPTTYSAVDQVISYSYLLTNSGNVTLSAPFTVADDKATDAACPATPTSLAPGASLTCSASYTIDQADLDAGTVTNVATGHGFFGAGPVNSNSDTETVAAVQSPALTLTKSAAPSTYDTVGQTISYSYVVQNTGNVTLSGPFTVADDKATDEACPATASLAPGASITCSASYAVTQADLDASKVTNKATASNGTVTSNEATATVYAVAHPNLSLVKTATPATYSQVGAIVSYSYVVTNIGNVALSAPYAVADDKASDEACPQTPNPLPVGASITCSASYTIGQADLDAGSVTNHATATATFGSNTVTSNEAQATVTAQQTRALALDKSAQETTYAVAGDVIHYSYLVTNAGNVTLHAAITVNDNKTTATCPALPAEGLAPGASITCSAGYTILQSDLDTGTLTNVASATDGTTTSPTDTVTVPATQSPALALVKSASPATYNAAGQTISYSYALKNTGNVTLSGPFTVTDDKATVTCPMAVTSLAVGDTLTCTASHTVTQAEVDSGSITNIAEGHAFHGTTPVDSNPDTKTVTAEKNPALTLVKTATPGTYDAVDDVISYSYLVTNSGNVTLYNLTVVDDKATVTCPDTSAGLAPTGQITCHAAYSITQVDLDAGSVTNSAYATDGTTNSTPDSETVNALQQGGLGLSKSAAPTTYSTVGDVIVYSYMIQNTGNVTLAGPFTVSDDHIGTPAGTAFTCGAGPLAPNATTTCTANYSITQADLDAGTVTNIATASGNGLTSNPAQATVAAQQTRALALDKSAQETTYAVAGDILHYSYLVTNAGNVTLHDPITVNDNKTTATCPALPVGGLAPGASITCSASYTILQSDLDAGALTNVASATDGSITSPTDSVTIPATQSPALTLKKSASPLTYTTVDQIITYDYLLTNSGNVTLSSPFAVTDDKATVTCPAAVTSLAPGATLNCTATYIITQADLDSGKVTNVATATAKFGDTTVTSNQDTATVTAVQNPELTLVKTASPSTYDAAGQTISYSYVLKNSGNVTLSGSFTVSDDKATVTCPATASLVPGASITCTASYVVTQVDLDAGSVTNTAKAKGSFGGKDVFSDEDSETVNAVPAPALSLVKSADPSTYDHVGQSIAYNYVLKNIGNVTLAKPFAITDDKAATVTCSQPDTLAVGDSITCNATYLITQADLDAGSVTNIATGHAATLGGTPVNSNDASATVNAVPKPALAIDKSAQETTYVKAGDIIHYSYVVTNVGNVTLHAAITVNDNKTTATCPALPAEGLAPGASITCSASYTIQQADLDAGALTNVAYATSGTTVSPSDTVTVPATQSKGIKITKSSDATAATKLGDTLTFSYLVANTGNTTISELVVSDPQPGLSAVSCPVSTLLPGATTTCTAAYVVTQADIDAGRIVNTGTANGSTSAGPVSDDDTLTTPLTQSKGIKITKSSDATTATKLGDTLTFSYLVANTGNTTISELVVSDPQPGLSAVSCPVSTLAPAATTTCTATYVVTQADIDAGQILNTGTASGSTPAGPVTDDDTLTTPLAQSPAIDLAKRVTSTGPYDSVGATISYELVATNTGNVTLHNVAISDPLLGALTCTQPVDLAPGASLTCTGSYAVTQADLNAGKVDNTATADSDETGPDTAFQTVPMVQNPALTVAKTATPTTYNKVGDVISYSYLVTNSGNVTLYKITVVDDKAIVACPDTEAGLAPLGTITCTASYTIGAADITAGSVTNTAYATDGTTQSTPDSQTVDFVNIPPDISVTKIANPTSVPETGGNVTFTFTVVNNASEAATITSLSDSKFGPLAGDADCQVGAILAANGGSCSFTAIFPVPASDLLGSHTNTFTAVATDPEGFADTATVDATVTYTNVPPSVTLDKSVDVEFLDEPGGDFTFMLTIHNTSWEEVTITALTDSQSGAAVDFSACAALIGRKLAAGASTSCTYVVSHTDVAPGGGGYDNAASVTVTDNDNSSAGANDSQMVWVDDVRPTITLEKLVTPTTLPEPGGDFHFTLSLTNTSVEPVMITQFWDWNEPAVDLTPYLGTWLQPGDVLEIPYAVNHTDAMTYRNDVTVWVQDNEENTVIETASQTVEVTDVPPTVTLGKTVTPATLPEPGGVFHFTLTITNNGPEQVWITDLTDTNTTILSDDCLLLLSDNAPYTDYGVIPAGESVQCTYDVTHTEAGSYDNTASVTVMDNELQEATASADQTVTVTPVAPVIAVTKAASEQQVFAPGENVEFTVVIANNSGATDPVTITSLVDSIHGDVTAIAGSTCALPQTIQPGKSYTCKFTVLVDGDETDRVTASGADDEGTPASAWAEATVEMVNPSLTIVKTTNGSDGLTLLVGTPLTWSYLVTNNGDVTLANITVSDDKFVDAICTIETLAAGASTTCTATGTAVPGQYTNIGTAAATYTDLDGDVKPLLSSDPSSYYGAAPALSLVKTATPATYSAVGDVIAYSYLVKNTGNVTLAGPVTVADDKATVTCPAGGLAPGAEMTCTASYTITQADLDAGSVKNTAKASANGTDSNTADATVTAEKKPALSLVKTATPATYSAVGDVIAYSYLVKNTGNVTLAGPVTVADDKATVTCPAGGLVPGAEMTCTASYTITQADLDNGSVTNKATAAGGGATSNEATATVTAVPTKALSLVKTADPLTYNAKDQTITYSYVIKNTGNVTLSGPFTVTDDKATVTCTQPADAALSPNEELTCTASYSITQTDLDDGSVTNKATASGGGATSNEATATVTAVPTKALSLVKTADPLTYNAKDQTITYSYVIKNTGNVTLSGPFAVTDDKATVTCTQPADAALSPNEEMTCTATYTITQTDLDAGSVINTATAAGGGVTSNEAQATVTAVQTRALAIDKSAQETTYARVGDVIHYSYLVTNAGNVTLHDPITVSDDKATDESCPVLPAGGLAPGQSITCTASYAVTQADLDAGSLTNVASATDDTTTSPIDTVTVPATQRPALELTKSASPATYNTAGQTINYSYVLKNTGNVTLNGPFTVTDDKAAVTCPPDVTSLAVGDTLTCSASHTVTQTEVDAGSITNIAKGHAFFGATPVDSNEDTETVTADKKPALTIVKTATPGTYDTLGQAISYSYLVTNSGNVTLYNISVVDDKASVTCPDTAAGLAPAGTITCTASYSITQADLDAGSVTNSAFATDGATSSTPDSETVNALQQGGLGLTKSASPTTYSKVGDAVSYSYVVKNTGNVTLAGPFTVNDDKVGAVSCPAGSLAPGATVTCTASYTIQQADLDAGSITNKATATDGTLTSNEAQATVTAVPKPALAIDKTAQETTYVKAGDVIHYSYLVTNAGNVTLHDPITVSDDKATDESCPVLPAGGLAPGQSITCTASYAVTQADLDAGSLTNVASATDGATTSPTDTVTVPATQRPALELTKSASPTTYNTVGQTINYSYMLKNTGNVTLSGPFTVTDDKAAVTCPPDVTSLAVGDTLTCSATHTITQADLENGKVTNTATASGGGVTSNQATATVTATLCKVLSLIKTATPTTYSKVGAVITYRYLVRNFGNVTLTGPFSVTDNKTTVTCTQPADGALSPNETMTCTATYTITQADLDNGKVTNKATASGGGAISNQATATVTAAQCKAMSLIKTASPTTYNKVGDIITYSYVIRNVGNVTLTGPFTVADNKTTVTCPPTASLAPGASTTCSASYTITAADVTAGKVTNTATAAGGGATSNTVTETVYWANPTAVTLSDFQATALSTGERLMALLRSWLQR